ncbi:phospholipase D beta 1-like [Corylus avellana]|uniref:phospholipase D beta 1-like n=1 Tax=Corylus avellana TaxID=13451 RepID=UPI00286A25E9|nr:phospholipase D beta 1-like [Corylus avellana]
MSNPALTECLSFGAGDHCLGQQAVPFLTNLQASLKVFLLHGNLDIWIREAKNLPNMDVPKNLGQMLSILPGKVVSHIEDQMSKKMTSDPYVVVSLSGAIIARTRVIPNSENPDWMQHFNVPVAHSAAEVLFVVNDEDPTGSDIIGVVGIPVEELYSGMKIDGTFPILSDSGEPCKAGAALSLSIQYTQVEKVVNLYQGVPGTYFPLRRGGKVTLYQDAHVHVDDHEHGCLPNLKLDGDVQYEHRDCWHDIYEAIKQAKRLIYIAGWSVNHNVRLIRDGNIATTDDCMLGDLLKAKAQQGVRVLLLVWNDPSSISIAGYKQEGKMKTNDAETRDFFKHTKVQVQLCLRPAWTNHSWAEKLEFRKCIYSHHQKTVIVDADAGHKKRKIVAFIGGLDLCIGRYDTPKHPLFRTLQTVHKDDYNNPTFKEPPVGCPRQPWHDLHSRIDGPAAWDILTNFKERWLRASKQHDNAQHKFESYYADIINGMADIPSQSHNDPEDWHVQVFRSIDSISVKGFPDLKDSKGAMEKNLVYGKNVLIDMSIHTAYVNAIRAAQKFIYIENQFFLGSSFNWDSHKDIGSNNLIPMEIALKIANKIKANERFSAYIVIPMRPEGDPTDSVNKQILYWQHKTMQMMYEIVYKALKEVGLENKYEPQDYLNFFCLGNREAPDRKDSLDAGNPTAARTSQALTRKSRRFMIYVHSKGMIVDDEYVILGSANINHRSMSGTRDTEIAMGAFQPNHTWKTKQSSPHGQIYGYRMSLWAEHTGVLEECFKQPESLECVRRLRLMGELNSKQYADDDVTEMKGHLLMYPVEVDRTVKVKPLPGCETFPDVGGNVTGDVPLIFKDLTI